MKLWKKIHESRKRKRFNMPKKQKVEKEKKQREEKKKNQKVEKKKKDSEEENKPTESSSNPLENKRKLSSRKNIKEMRQEEAQSSKRSLPLRKSRMKRGSSMSLLSLLIAEEVISAGKVEDNEKRIKFQLTDDLLNARNVLQESLLTIKEYTHEGVILEESVVKPTQTSPSSSRKPSKMIITPKSSTIFSHLLGTQSKDYVVQEREEFKKLNDKDEMIKGAEDDIDKDEKDELLLGYRNIKTNEMKIAAIPANSFIIYEDHKNDGRVFTIVVRKEDIPQAAVSSKGSIHDEKKGEFASNQSLAGYVYPSWPKRNSGS